MISLFVVTGFLDSGKTTLVKETLMKQDWIEDGLTLLISCEEGEEEYSKAYLEENNMILLQVDDFSQLNETFFRNCERHYMPMQVVIEYNGMWSLEKLLSIRYPRNWELSGVYSTVNGTTLDMYLKNMRNLLMEQLVESELIVVNRCPDGVNRAGFRRAVKVQNPTGQLLFEDMAGNIIEPSAEDLPYDVKADKIVIEDDDFGIWFVDVSDHPEFYLHKEIEFKAQAMRQKGMPDNLFLPVRLIMTCCADDVRFYGYPCKSEEKLEFDRGEWVLVRARMEYESLTGGDDRMPVLHLIEMRSLDEPEEIPEEDIVYLG